MAARRELAEWAGPRLVDMAGSPEMIATEAGRAIGALVQDRGAQAVGRDLPFEVLDEFVAAGNASACARMARRLLNAGADRVALVPNPAGLRTTDSMVDQIRAAATLLHD